MSRHSSSFKPQAVDLFAEQKAANFGSPLWCNVHGNLQVPGLCHLCLSDIDRQTQAEMDRYTIHDTFEIAEIYMQRPQQISGMAMSVWFIEAHKRVNPKFAALDILMRSTNLLETKRMIVAYGFNKLSLDPLRQYNEFRSKS